MLEVAERSSAARRLLWGAVITFGGGCLLFGAAALVNALAPLVK